VTFAQPFSEYEVLDRVGAGSMGTVFKAHHKKLNRIVALKVLRPSLGRDTRYVDRLRREARIVASLNHPNIVTGYDLGQEGGYHFFVMEFIEGKSLRELLSEWGMFDEERVLDVAMQITVALNHAFERGVIHRDIKPANILIDKSNVVKLTDMGLAKGPDNLTITRDGATLGTPQYISPEQARNPQDVDVRTDLYSLGATLFHMCTGQPPFRAETMANVLCKVLEERAPSASGINPDLSDGLNLIIRKLLTKDPDGRYQTPAALLADLQRVQRAELPHVKETELDRGEEGKVPLSWLKVAMFVVLPTGLALAMLFLFMDWGGSVNETSLAERKRAYHSLVARDLAKYSKVGSQIQYLRSLRENAAEKFEEDYLDDKLTGLILNLRGAIPVLLRQEESHLEQTFAKLSWNRTKRDLEKLVADRVRGELGLSIAVLPREAAEEYAECWRELEIGLIAKIAVRENEFHRAVTKYGDALRRKVQARLSESDFRGAANVLAQGLEGFGRVSRDFPPLLELPGSLQASVDKARSRHAVDLEALITGLERARRKSFEAGLAEVVARVDGLLAGGESDVARNVYEELSRDLEQSFPRRFRPEYDVWPDADIRLGRLDAKLGTAESGQRSKALRQVVSAAYRIVLSGNLRKARSELVVGAHGRQESALLTHIKLLDYVIAVRSKLLDALLGSTEARQLQNVRAVQGRLTVEIRRQSDDYVVRVAGRSEPIALGLLRVADLIPKEFFAKLSEQDKAGLAVWYLLTGTKEVAFLTEGGALAGFVRDEVTPLLDELEPLEPSWLAARQLLESIREAVVQSEWDGAGKSLASLRSGYTPFADANDEELRRLDRAIGIGLIRSKLDRELRPQVLAGGTLQVGNKFEVSLEYPDLSKVKFAAGLPAGWIGDDPNQRLVFGGDGAELDKAKPLVFQSLCLTAKPIAVALEFAFAAEAGVTRFFFLTMHEATLGLAALHDGTVVVFEVDKLRAGKDVQAKIRKALGSAGKQPVAHLVPGARHRLEVEVRPRGLGGKVLMHARLDGRKLPALSIVRSTGKVAKSVVLTALQGMEVYSISCRGLGR
jgi:predicted Ser/Thr protein kinase